MKATRTRFYCRLFAETGNDQIATSIQVIVPPGLTREQVVDYVTGRIAGEVRRYAAYEAVGLSYSDHHTDWSEKVT
jgi:hypothetical protein